MKKLLTALLTCVLTLFTAIALTACNGGGWEGTSMKSWGAVKNSGGFVAETENYVYYINGLTDSSGDNTFGAPVKGALMAAQKSDLSKTEIVVPKLFTSSDYSAGFYIYGSGNETYVYYGTPCTEKNSAGDVAKDELTFMRTRLDGEKTETFFTASALSVQFRIVENNGVVYIVYYDADQSALIVYNTSTKKSSVIAKTESDVQGRYTSLDAYKFVDNEATGEAVLLYTVSVYSEDYNAEKAKKGGYSRAQENYNKVFAYKAGDAVASGNETAGTCVLSGEADQLKYSLTYVDGTIVYYTESDILSNTTTYASEIKDLADKNARTEILNSEAAVGGNLIEDFENVYVMNEDGTAILKTSLLSKNAINDEKVALCSVSSILFIEDGYIYYLNSETEIYRTKLSDENAVAERVSSGSVASSWYAPERVVINDETYLFYCDTTTVGSSYVAYINLDKAEVIEEDTDDDQETDLYYLSGNAQIGKMLEKDKANLFVDAMNGIADETLTLAEENGEYVFKPAVDARAVYNGLSEEAKKSVGGTYLEKLDKIEKAVKLCNLYKDLEDIDQYSFKSETEQDAIKNAYETAKNYRISIIEEYSSDVLISIRDTYIPEELSYYYATAQDVFGDRD